MIFCLQVSVGIFRCCLPGIDHRHTNAKTILVSLEFSAGAAIETISYLNRVPEIHFLPFLDIFWIFFVNIFYLEVSVDFCLQVSLDIFKCFCLPGIDHRHTNAKNVFVSLEFSVVATI